jgi:drug/metabolite transporter (DMT)-like permease
MNKFAHSIQNNALGILLMLVSAFGLATGQLFWKISAGDRTLFLLIGFALYGVSALFMVIAYRHGSLSVLHPMMSMSYVMAFVLGGVFLHESVNVVQIGGLLFVLLGAILIGGGDA